MRAASNPDRDVRRHVAPAPANENARLCPMRSCDPDGGIRSPRLAPLGSSTPAGLAGPALRIPIATCAGTSLPSPPTKTPACVLCGRATLTEGFGHLASLRSAPRPRPGLQARPFESRSRRAQARRSRPRQRKRPLARASHSLAETESTGLQVKPWQVLSGLECSGRHACIDSTPKNRQ